MNPVFMQEAIRLARENLDLNHGGPFGAVVVRSGKIVSQGWNQVTSTCDPTAHAEIVALRAAGRILGKFCLDDCELYTSCEPCPMCLAAVYWARIPVVYYAGTRGDAAAAGFDDDLFYAELARPMGQRRMRMIPLLREEAQLVFEAWQAKSDKIPY
jgi:tRNA(Arg) A34 adenosine deaminase TadA